VTVTSISDISESDTILAAATWMFVEDNNLQNYFFHKVKLQFKFNIFSVLLLLYFIKLNYNLKFYIFSANDLNHL
jgi:hypothetical protein